MKHNHWLLADGKMLAAETRTLRRLEQSKRRNAANLRKRQRTEAAIAATEQADGFYSFRIRQFRPEARAFHLALGFFRGHPYSVMERTAFTRPNFARVEALVSEYMDGDPRTTMQKFAEWLDDANAYYERQRTNVSPVVAPAKTGWLSWLFG